MKINREYRRIVLVLMTGLLSVMNAAAQIGLPGDGDVDDVPEAPIDDLILPVCLTALALGFWALKKRRAYNA